MKTRLIPSALAAAALIGLIATTGWSEEKTETKKKAHPLGAQHTLLGDMVGEWDVAGEYFMGGGSMPYTGTATGTWEIGDKFLKLAFESQLPMGKLEVVAFHGYDRDKKRWQSVSMRSMGAMGGEMINAEPVWDEASRSWTSKFDSSGMMGPVSAREVYTLKEDGSIEHLLYVTPKTDGAKETLQMKLTYTAKK